MSLNLGKIPFPADHTPYRSPEKRRRAPGGALPPARSGAGDGAPRPVVGATTAASDVGDEPRSRLAELSIRPDSFGPVDQRFLLGATEERLGRSVAASIGSHVVGLGVILLLLSFMPERVFEQIRPNRDPYPGIVWLPEEGPGGGGGGGGNESIEPPRLVELEGPDEAELSVPVPEPVQPDPAPEPEVINTQELRIPAVSMASARQTRPGVFDGLRNPTSTSQGSGTGGGGGSGDGTGIGPGQGSGLGPGQGGGTGGGVYRPGSGIRNPQLVREVKPKYTAEAMRAKVQGTVWLEVVVKPDGTVGDVTVTKSLDTVFGLDEEAIKAARQWRFVPGTRLGEPVAVLVGIELSFTLR